MLPEYYFLQAFSARRAAHVRGHPCYILWAVESVVILKEINKHHGETGCSSSVFSIRARNNLQVKKLSRNYAKGCGRCDGASVSQNPKSRQLRQNTRYVPWFSGSKLVINDAEEFLLCVGYESIFETNYRRVNEQVPYDRQFVTEESPLNSFCLDHVRKAYLCGSHEVHPSISTWVGGGQHN